MRIRSRVVLLLVAAFAISWDAPMAAAQPVFPLHTSGRYIVDSNGVRVHLNGVNWYGAESTDFVVAGLQVASLQSIVQQIKSMGFNVVRLPWSNQLYESNPVVGNYALAANPTMQGEDALTILDQVVAALTNAGIMVILDNHNSNAEWCCSTTDGNTLWYNSQYPQSSWIADWQGMAQRYQNNPWVIGADLRNEPRGSASWGGSSTTDWHAAAILGGNAVLSVNPNLLIFVEGVSYALDLSGAASLPVQLNVANRLVYEAHDYGTDSSGLIGYSNYVGQITPKWGYLVTGGNPQPLWVGEFGTCNTANTCVSSSSSSDKGYWFNMTTAYFQEYSIDWTYWAVNGTHSTGGNASYGSTETYGVLNAMWNGSALAALTTRLGSLTPAANPGFALIPNSGAISIPSGASASSTVAIVPQNGFTGTVNLSCAVSGSPSGTAYPPSCTVPLSQTVTSAAATSVTVIVATTGSGASISPVPGSMGRFLYKLGGAEVACLMLLMGSLTRRRRALQRFLLLIAAAIPFLGCGGSGGNSNSLPGTTAGAYTVTITGSAPGLTPVAAQISVTIQ
jgi:endoglucanase